jgi:hypothetical protein
MRLLADSEFADNLAVTVCIALLQVIQQAATLAHKHQESAARTVVLLVLFEVLRQLANTLAQNRDLYLRTPGVGVMRPKLCNNVCLFSRCQHSFFYS